MTAIEKLKFPISFYTQRAWNALHRRELKACCYFYHKHSNKETSHYTALIMVEYLRCFVLPFSAYPYRYRPPPRGTWGVPTSASVARDTSTRSMTSAGSSMVRWWRRNTTRCYAGNPTGARSAVIIFTDKIVIRHFLIGLKMFKKLVLKVATVWGHIESPASSCVSTDFILRLARLDLNRRDAMFLFYWILQLFTFSSRYDTLKCRIAGASSVTISWLLLSLSFFLYLWNRS